MTVRGVATATWVLLLELALVVGLGGAFYVFGLAARPGAPAAVLEGAHADLP